MAAPVTVQSLYRDAMARLKQAGCATPGLDARILLRHALNMTDADLITGDDRVLDAAAQDKIESLIARRLSGEPVSRITGHREFWGLDFMVTPDVLDPRTDTETIVQAAVQTLRKNPPQRIIDLGTGSGCLLIALLTEFPAAVGVGVDISESALSVARLNAERNNVTGRATFVRSHWFESVDGKFDLIVSNPPYIPNPDIESLAIEVRNHDPILALAGGEDGYDAYRAIIKEIQAHANRGALCYFEVGLDQGENVARLAGESNLSVRRIIPDIAGIPRAVEISCGDN